MPIAYGIHSAVLRATGIPEPVSPNNHCCKLSVSSPGPSPMLQGYRGGSFSPQRHSMLA